MPMLTSVNGGLIDLLASFAGRPSLDLGIWLRLGEKGPLLPWTKWVEYCQTKKGIESVIYA